MPTYYVTVDKEEHAVEIEETAAGLFKMTLDGVAREVDARPAPGEVLSLLIDGVSYETDIEHAPRKQSDDLSRLLNLRVHNNVIQAEVLDARSRNLRDIAGSATAAGGRQEIVSPMPGKVVKVLCEVGAAVKSGQGVVVVEAMKMENELKSPVDGKVVEVKATTGSAVDGGAVLVVVE